MTLPGIRIVVERRPPEPASPVPQAQRVATGIICGVHSAAVTLLLLGGWPS